MGYHPLVHKESDTTECLTHYSDIILAVSEGSRSSTSGLLKAHLIHSLGTELRHMLASGEP